jgi:hypothetical protein
MNETSDTMDQDDTDTEERDPESRGPIDRRKFVAGMSALGAGAAAGCLSDDGGSTDTPGGTDPATDADTSTGTDAPPGTTDGTPEPGTDTQPPGTEPTETEPTETEPTETEPPGAGEAFEPLPRNLVYQYYEGGFSGLPNFDNLAPTAGGELGAEKISLDPAERGENYALVFEGEFVVGGRLPAATYTFAADADDEVKLYVNGNSFLEATDGRVEEPVRLAPGTYDFRVEYLQTSGSSRLGLGWKGQYGELLPRLAKTDPFRADLGMPMTYQGPTDPSLEIDVGTRPRVKRIQMPGASAKALAVGMPDLTNYCFDPTTAGVKYAWRGAFINYGPIISYGSGRGDDEADLLGMQFPIGGMDYPLRIGDADAEPDVSFRGCREAPHPPELHYTVDGHEITHTVEGAPDGLGVTHTVGFEESLSQMTYFHTADDDIEREASTGQWNGTTLEVPAGVEEFSVTVTGGVE